MNEKIYVVVLGGNKQTHWFGSLEKASQFIAEFGRGKPCSVYEYSLAGEVLKTDQEPLYKKLW